MANAIQTPAGYPELLQELKTRIRAAQVRAAFAVSRELILLYWSIGREILTRQDAQGWGAKIVERLARDLQTEFPGVEGFSARSLKHMRAFAAAWPDEPIVQRLAAQLSWGTTAGLLEKGREGKPRQIQPKQSRRTVATILNLLADQSLRYGECRPKATFDYPEHISTWPQTARQGFIRACEGSIALSV